MRPVNTSAGCRRRWRHISRRRTPCWFSLTKLPLAGKSNGLGLAARGRKLTANRRQKQCYGQPEKTANFEISAPLNGWLATGSADPDSPGGRRSACVPPRRREARSSHADDPHGDGGGKRVAPGAGRASKDLHKNLRKPRRGGWHSRIGPARIRQWRPPAHPLSSDRKSWSALRAEF